MSTSHTILPIVFTLVGGPFIPMFQVFGTPEGPSPAGCIRPETLFISRPARGTVVNTAGAAFLEDFGEGIPVLEMSGTTGFGGEISGYSAGFTVFKNIELMFENYLSRRQQLSEGGIDPNIVRLFYFDTLNAEAFMVYPNEFVFERSKSRPLLFQYRMRLTVLQDILESALNSSTVDSLLSQIGGVNIPQIGNTLGGTLQGLNNIISTFGGLIPVTD